jgi:hypothetical protein
LVFRNGGISESCQVCARTIVRRGKPGDLCNSGREQYWKFKCANISVDMNYCKMPDCFPDPNHRCHSPLIDHRPSQISWSKISEMPQFYFHDPSKVCSTRFTLNKMRRPEDMLEWWKITQDSNSAETIASTSQLSQFQDISHYLMYPNKDLPQLCKVVNPEEPAKVGRDVHPVLNFHHDWGA